MRQELAQVEGFDGTKAIPARASVNMRSVERQTPAGSYVCKMEGEAMSETASRKAYHLGLKADRKVEPRPKGVFGEPRRYPGARQQGQHDKNTKDLPLHEAIVQAAALSGYDKNGADGLVGYLKNLADNRKDLFMPLLGRALLLQPNLKSEKPVVRYTTVEEARAACIARRIDPDVLDKAMMPPWPPPPPLRPKSPQDKPDTWLLRSPPISRTSPSVR